MSRGIGLDHPYFRGNIRTYRRREIVQPARRPIGPSGLVEDVSDTVVQSYVFSQTTFQEQPIEVDKQQIAEAEIPVSYQPLIQELEPDYGYLDDDSQDFDEEDAIARQFFEEAYQDEIEPNVQSIEQEPTKSSRDFRFGVSLLGKIKKENILSPRFALPALAVTIFLVGCGVALQGLHTNRKVQAQVQELSSSSGAEQGISGSEDIPDETEPDVKTFGSYRVAPDLPRYIRINKIGVNSRVIRVGVKENNELRAPNNIYDTGWYENSAKPGEKGATLLDGHVHGPTKPGVFYNLKKLVAGDEIEIERGDGVLLKYKVTEVETKGYQEVDMDKAMRSTDPDKSGLTIITCTGKYNKELKQYEQRQIVYAVQI